MSINIQKHLKERSLRNNSSKKIFDDQIYSDGYIISQMTLERELPGHTGCVNTLDWSLLGDKLLSGSDDTKLNIYLPFEDYKLSTSIDTGHRANIFTAKFMPQRSDNVIISGAGDSEIRIFDLQNIESPLFSMYVCHSDQIKKICVYDDNPNEFLTCSQDGTVRQFDLRIPHICSPHSVRSFLTAQHKPAKQNPLPNGIDIENGCPHPIVDYGKYNIELNSMTINKLLPQYFAVAGMNDYIYLHDRRMMQSMSSSNNIDIATDLKCVKRFSPRLDGFNRPNKHITACQFSDSNGYELIGSWSSDAIYLFNINDAPIHNNNNNDRSSSSSSSKRAKHSHQDTNEESEGSSSTVILMNSSDQEEQETIHTAELWEKIIHYYTRHDLSSALCYTDKLLNYFESWDMDEENLGKSCLYFIRASILMNEAANSNGIESSNYTNIHDVEVNELTEKGETFAPLSWLGLWCKAIGYWLLGGGVYSNGSRDRRVYLELSLEYAMQSKSTLEEITVRNSEEGLLYRIYFNMMDTFLLDLEIVFILEGYTENTRNITLVNLESQESENRFKWVKFMYISQLPSDPLQLSMLVSMSGLNPTISSPVLLQSTENNNENNQTMESSSSSDTDSSSTTTESDRNEEDNSNNEEEDQSLFNRIMSRQILDIYRHGYDDISDDEDFDLEALAILRENSNISSFDTDIGVVKPRSKFTGHCNIETVKDVGFYGIHDEYIMSGSDRGHLFIWDKKTTKIVQILRADEDVVNVAKGHPFLPYLAVSGIDSTVKIFKPISRLPSSSKKLEPNNPNSYSSSSNLFEQEEIIETNDESNRSLGDDIYMTRSMYAAFLRMERQRRLFVANGILNDDETTEEED